MLDRNLQADGRTTTLLRLASPTSAATPAHYYRLTVGTGPESDAAFQP